jgi:hypothetical protein
LNRQSTGWSWVTDDSYRSTVDREADGSRRWMQSGWLRQQLGDRVGFCVYSSNLMLLDKLCMWVVSSWEGRCCLSSHFWCRRIESSDRIACQKTWWTWVRSSTVVSDRERPIDTEFVNNFSIGGIRFGMSSYKFSNRITFLVCITFSIRISDTKC